MSSEFNEILKFPSINSARLYFRVRFSTISKNINNTILIQGVNWSIKRNNSTL